MYLKSPNKIVIETQKVPQKNSKIVIETQKVPTKFSKIVIKTQKVLRLFHSRYLKSVTRFKKKKLQLPENL